MAANKGLKVKTNNVPNSNQNGGKSVGIGSASNNAAGNGGDDVVK